MYFNKVVPIDSSTEPLRGQCWLGRGRSAVAASETVTPLGPLQQALWHRHHWQAAASSASLTGGCRENGIYTEVRVQDLRVLPLHGQGPLPMRDLDTG